MIELSDYKIKNVAIYLRKSRGESDVDLQKQQDTLTEICSKEGWEYEIYEEIANSDSLELRTEAQRLLADVEFGMYDAVLVVAVDRLSRAGSRDSDIVRKFLIDSSTYLIENTTINNLEDDSSDINYNVKALVAQLEYKLIKKRLRSGKVQAAKRGFWPNGVPPLPYVYNKIRHLILTIQCWLHIDILSMPLLKIKRLQTQ